MSSSDRNPDTAGAKKLERAEQVFLEAIARSGGDGLDADALEALCGAHPALAVELREQHAHWNWLDGVSPPETEALFKSALTDKLSVGAVLQIAGTRDDENRYTLLDEIARGGMATIFKAWDAHLKRTLAMKVAARRRIKSGSSSRASSSRVNERFLEEASIMGRLEHPGIVPVHDIGIDAAGHMYFTMQLVKGHDLKTVFEMVRSGSEGWSLMRATGVLIKVCETLGYAHSKGVIHRDIKPANIMVGPFGQAYVMDWGLARSVGRTPYPTPPPTSDATDIIPTPGDGLLTEDGQVLGTPAYMPPEQARGDLRSVGTRSDIYAVGAMLYDVLSGHSPYADQVSTGSKGMLAAVRDSAPTSLDRTARGAPDELVAVAEKAMARESRDRYANMQDLAADLRSFLEGRVVGAHSTGALVELRKWIQRNRLAAGAIGVAALLLPVAAAVVAWIQLSKNAALEDTNRQIAATGLELLASNDHLSEERERADLAAYAARIAAAQASLQSNRVDIATGHLDACPTELRGWEWHHLRSRLDSSLATLPDPDGRGARAWGVAFSPDGETVASGDFDGRVRLWQIPPSLDDFASAPLTFMGHTGWVRALAIDSRGRWIATGSEDGTLKLWHRTTGELVWDSSAADVTYDLAFNAAGDRIVTASNGGAVKVWDTEGGELLVVLRGHVGRVDCVRFGPTGSTVITVGSDSSLRVWDAGTGELLRESEVFDPLIETNRDKALDVSPDGHLFAVGGPAGDLRILNATTLETTRFLQGHDAHVKSVAFSPDGALLASASADHTFRVWNVATGAEIYIGRGHTQGVASVAWHPNAEILATSSDDGSVKLWDLGASADVDSFDMGMGMAVSVSIRPDGQELAVGRNVGPIRIEAQSGEVRFGVSHRALFESGTAYDPSGTSFAAAFGDDWTLGVWENEDQAEPAVLTGHGGLITDIEFSADGTMLASASLDDTVRVWRAGDWSNVTILGPHRDDVYCLAFAPSLDDPRLVSATYGGWVRVWDPRDGRLVIEWKGHDAPVRGTCFSPDGTLLVTTSEDHTIKLWNTTDWTEVRTLLGHTNGVHSPVFHPDGSRLATCSRDRTVRLWDVESGINVATLLGHRGWVTALAFSPDGSWLASGSNDKSVILWETTRSTRRVRALGEAMRKMAPRVADWIGESESASAVMEAIESDTSLDPVEARAARSLARMSGGL